MNDDLTKRLLDTVDSIDSKVDALCERTTRVEEQQKASRDAQEQRHGDNKLAMHHLTQEVAELRKTTATGLSDAGGHYGALELKVTALDERIDGVAGRVTLVENQITGAALKGGGIGGLIATAVTTGIAIASWVAGWLHLTPPPSLK